jgi:D-lactate dehydrogenase
MKIAFFEIKDWERTFLKKRLKNEIVKFFNEPINLENIKEIKDFDVICGFVNSKITKEIIDNLPKLKLISTMSTGFDHIDIKYAKKKGISVTSVPVYGENTVAEHTFALILSLSRNIHKTYVRTIAENYKIDGLMGFDLKGKTLGVIGGGHIGMHVAKMAKAFNMDVLVFDLFHDSLKSELIGFKYETLDNIYSQSDIISLHLPYNENTHHLINKKAFLKMKKGVLIINTARGGIVDTESLVWALDKKIVSGAGLDVLENEADINEEKQVLSNPKHEERYKSLVLNHILLKKENVVYTPHTAFFSKEALVRILSTTVENINDLKTKKFKNLVK